jgi:hypothetical protein
LTHACSVRRVVKLPLLQSVGLDLSILESCYLLSSCYTCQCYIRLFVLFYSLSCLLVSLPLSTLGSVCTLRQWEEDILNPPTLCLLRTAFYSLGWKYIRKYISDAKEGGGEDTWLWMTSDYAWQVPTTTDMCLHGSDRLVCRYYNHLARNEYL